MISTYSAVIFAALIVVCIIFLGYNIVSKRRQQFVQRLYSALCSVFVVWLIAMLGLKFTDVDNYTAMYFWDALTQVGVAFTPVIMLMIAMAFSEGRDTMPRSWRLLLIIPILTNIIVWTNPLHHLQYQVFSIIRSELVFGPYIFISGAYTYVCLLLATAILLRFGVKSHNRLCWLQVIMLIIGEIVPLAVSVVATLSIINLSIAATPLSFTVTLLCTYFAIYQLHLLDIVPIATQHILDWIPDGYLVLNEHFLVVDENRHFREVFGKMYGITVNKRLSDVLTDGDEQGKTALYKLISALGSCAENQSQIAYEQAVTMTSDVGTARKAYYMVDITPLEIEKQLSGFVVFFKDITQVKKSMQQVQEGQARMMEQERLAMLGQMVGGLAHNLKTPIMSISGCASAVETLVKEARSSLGDPDVTEDDFREIYGEIDGWLEKTHTSCAYMSDIITAIKGQAANVNTSEEREFTLDELIKRTTLLMRHELLSSGCKLVAEYGADTKISLRGDINNLIQVLNNLIGNAIDAEKQSAKKEIYIGCERDETNLSLYVKDCGCGVDPHVREHLFKEMITSKGTHGTGLGLYISSTVIRGKFGGFMWEKDNPSGGSIFGFSIPLDTSSGSGDA